MATSQDLVGNLLCEESYSPRTSLGDEGSTSPSLHSECHLKRAAVVSSLVQLLPEGLLTDKGHETLYQNKRVGAFLAVVAGALYKNE